MATESATYIDGLDSSKPAGTESPAEGDDHLRLIKSTVKATFPNLTGAVTATQAELNIMDGVTSSTAELNILDGVTSTAAELNLLDNAVANTVVNSKAVIYGSGGQITAATLTATSGSITSDSNSDSANVLIDGATSKSKNVVFVTAGSSRWGISSTDTAESGSDAGSNFQISRYNDSGVYVDAPISISRATGDVTIAGDQISISTAQTPANAGATGVKGTICWDASYIYVCVDTNTWKRAAIDTWT